MLEKIRTRFVFELIPFHAMHPCFFLGREEPDAYQDAGHHLTRAISATVLQDIHSADKIEQVIRMILPARAGFPRTSSHVLIMQVEGGLNDYAFVPASGIDPDSRHCRVSFGLYQQTDDRAIHGPPHG
jgi:hypothetical protein